MSNTIIDLNKQINNKLLGAGFSSEEILEVSVSECQSKAFIKIKSEKFSNMSQLKRHRFIIDVIGKGLIESIHAVSLELLE